MGPVPIGGIIKTMEDFAHPGSDSPPVQAVSTGRPVLMIVLASVAGLVVGASVIWYVAFRHTAPEFEPVVVFTPAGLFSDEDREELMERVAQPFFDYHNENGLKFVSMHIEVTSGRYSYFAIGVDGLSDASTILIAGTPTGELFEPWVPECLETCEFSDAFREKYPDTIQWIDRPVPSNLPKDLHTIFDLDSKEPGTELYYSEALGVGFTYLVPTGLNPEADVAVNEFGNTISVFGQSIEVFDKDPSLSFKETIEQLFLSGYDPAECWVVLRENSEQRLPFYVSAEITFPPPTDPNTPWWENASACPQRYSQVNAMQYFVYNEKVTDTFLFVRVGQDSPASDGTPRTAEGGFNWTHSIRILE